MGLLDFTAKITTSYKADVATHPRDRIWRHINERFVARLVNAGSTVEIVEEAYGEVSHWWLNSPAFRVDAERAFPGIVEAGDAWAREHAAIVRANAMIESWDRARGLAPISADSGTAGPHLDPDSPMGRIMTARELVRKTLGADATHTSSQATDDDQQDEEHPSCKACPKPATKVWRPGVFDYAITPHYYCEPCSAVVQNSIGSYVATGARLGKSRHGGYWEDLPLPATDDDSDRWPHTCGRCGGPAYCGIGPTECKAGCK